MTLNTYIFYTTNHEGYEWVDDKGEYDFIQATSLQEAVHQWSYVDSMFDQIQGALVDEGTGIFKSNRGPSKLADVLPLNVSISVIPATATILPQEAIDAALQAKIDLVHQEVVNAWAGEEALAKEKQDKIEKLKTEAEKLGLSLEDLASSGGW